MKTFMAKVVVKLKPNISDRRGQALKNSVESIIDIKNLHCRIGTSYSFEFDAQNQVDALKIIEKIAEELLVNDINEHFEIRSLVEI